MTEQEEPWQVAMDQVLARVREHRHEQVARYGLQRGAQGLADGTGPGVPWLPKAALGAVLYGAGAQAIERAFRLDYNLHGGDAGANWMRLVREEIAESFAENDPDRLAEELVQVAALCVSWLEDLMTRAKIEPTEENHNA